MKRSKTWAWVVFILGALYFIVPLLATVQFSLLIRRGTLSLDAYTNVIQSPQFQQTFSYSLIVGAAAIVGVIVARDRQCGRLIGRRHRDAARQRKRGDGGGQCSRARTGAPAARQKVGLRTHLLLQYVGTRRVVQRGLTRQAHARRLDHRSR